MGFVLPSSLTPSKVASFKDCALAFRFSAIDRLPEPPTAAAMKGTLVHSALERLFWDCNGPARNIGAAMDFLDAEYAKMRNSQEWQQLGLGDDEAQKFANEAGKAVRNYFELEDPAAVNMIGTELMLETTGDAMTLRGIIDRLDVDDNGDLTVVDYKTGRAPGVDFEFGKLGGVQFYAYLCEQVLGRRPIAVRLLYLRNPIAITAIPSEQSIKGMRLRTSAIWKAVERACEREDFRPNPGKLCDWCSFQEYCPAQGGTLPEMPTNRMVS